MKTKKLTKAEMAKIKEDIKAMTKRMSEISEALEADPNTGYELFDNARCAVDNLIGVAEGLGIDTDEIFK